MTQSPIVAALEIAVQEAKEFEAPLSEKLQHVASAVRKLSTTFAEAVDRLIARLEETGAGDAAPKPGDPMPSFALPDADGRILRLEALLANGPVAISFNRGHWCPYCRLNTMALSEAGTVAAEQGGQLVAILPERRRFTSAMRSESKAPFPILTDMDNGYALSLNLAIWVGTEMQELIGGAGWDLPTYQGNDSWIVPIPATFVVGTDGIIKARYVDPDYRRRMEIDDLLSALKSAG